jgi:hypothetical protein
MPVLGGIAANGAATSPKGDEQMGETHREGAAAPDRATFGLED